MPSFYDKLKKRRQAQESEGAKSGTGEGVAKARKAAKSFEGKKPAKKKACPAWIREEDCAKR